MILKFRNCAFNLHRVACIEKNSSNFIMIDGTCIEIIPSLRDEVFDMIIARWSQNYLIFDVEKWIKEKIDGTVSKSP